MCILLIEYVVYSVCTKLQAERLNQREKERWSAQQDPLEHCVCLFILSHKQWERCFTVLKSSRVAWRKNKIGKNCWKMRHRREMRERMQDRAATEERIKLHTAARLWVCVYIHICLSASASIYEYTLSVSVCVHGFTCTCFCVSVQYAELWTCLWECPLYFGICMQPFGL